MAVLQQMLEGDAALPVRGLGPAAFSQCLVALRSVKRQRVSSPDEVDDADLDERDEGGRAQPLETEQDDVEHVFVGEGANKVVLTLPRSQSQQEEQMRAAIVSRGHSYEAPLLGAMLRGWDERRLWLRRTLRLVLRSRLAARTAVALVLLNMVVLLVEAQLSAQGDDGAMHLLESSTTCLFDVVFSFEVVIGLWAFGARRYLSSVRHTYASGVALVTLIADSVSWWSAPGAAVVALQVAQLLRLLRSIRLLFSSSRFEAIFGGVPKFPSPSLWTHPLPSPVRPLPAAHHSARLETPHKA